MKVGRVQTGQLTDTELRNRKAEALAWAEAEFPDRAVTVHAFYAGDFYVEVRKPGEKRAPVLPAPSA